MIHPNSLEQFRHQMQIHKAHLVMLAETNIISSKNAAQIARALRDYSVDELPRDSQGYLTLSYVTVEKQLLQKAGEMAGNLHIARSNNDMGVTMARMALRERLLLCNKALCQLAEALIGFAEKHVDTLTVGYTHTQHGQPTTMAHYALAVLDGVFRSMERLKAAYRNVNRCPMGAGAITTSGFPIDRKRVAGLLAFDEPIGNAYDAIAGADHVLECQACLSIMAVELGRVTQDLLTWHTEEFAAVSLPDDLTGTSSIMPQKRNPGALEHLRAAFSEDAGSALSGNYSIHNTPFGDISDIKVTPESSLWQTFDHMTRDIRMLARIFSGIWVDREGLERRCRESLCTLTELADEIVRRDICSFRTAHSICAQLAKLARSGKKTALDLSYEDFCAAVRAVLDHDIPMSEAEFREAIDPRRFVEKRGRPGGPAPEEVRRMLAERREKLSAVRGSIKKREECESRAESELERAFAALCSQA